MDEQATQNTQPKKRITWEQVVDFVYTVSGALRRGGSVNVTAGPYLSSVSVAPVVKTPAIPWRPILIGGGLLVGLLIVLKD